MKNHLILFTFLFWTKTLFSDVPPLPCYQPFLSEIGAFGDSRAFHLSGYVNFIRDASINVSGVPKPILSQSPIQVNSIEKRAWFGSKTVDWIQKFIECHNRGTAPFVVHPKTIISLGGNDLLDFYKYRDKYEEDYNQGALANFTLLYLQAMLGQQNGEVINDELNALFKIGEQISKFLGFQNSHQNTSLNPLDFGTDFLSYWDHVSETETDDQIYNMEIVLYYIMNQSSSHRIILNTIAPVQKNVYIYIGTKAGRVDDIPMLHKLFIKMNYKIKKKVFVDMHQDYGDRVVLLDMFPAFYVNSLYDRNPSFYTDGIHFTGEGLQRWGIYIALKSIFFNWFSPGSDPSLFSEFFMNEELDYARALIDMKAIDKEIPIANIISTRMQRIPNGYKKDFGNERAIYLKDYKEEAFLVQGGILTLGYKKENEADGRFKFPVSDEYREQLNTIANSDFECGRIYWNFLAPNQPSYTYDPKKPGCPK